MVNVPSRHTSTRRRARTRPRPVVSARRTRRRAIGAAATFAVAAGTGVAGGKLTNSLTPALAVFAGLVIMGMVLTYGLSRADGIPGSGRNDQTESLSRSGPPYLRGARGVQIGHGNVQQNYFTQDSDD
jgi:hypothetical protein